MSLRHPLPSVLTTTPIATTALDRGAMRGAGFAFALAALLIGVACGDDGDAGTGAGTDASTTDPTGSSGTTGTSGTAATSAPTGTATAEPTTGTTAEPTTGTTADPSTSTSDTDTSTGTTGTTTGGTEVEGCEGQTLFENPINPANKGAWDVGSARATVAGLDVEVWYPAAPGSLQDQAPRRYDPREYLDPAEAAKIADEVAPFQTCDCVEGLPIDPDRGQFPVIIFVHGTAGFPSQSLEQVQHWASRGFVVLAAAHPGLFLGDALAGFGCGTATGPRDLAGNIDALLAALQAPSGDLAFLAGRIDITRIGMAGHSAGGGAIEPYGDVAQVLAPLAAGGTQAGTALQNTLVMGGLNDSVVNFNGTQMGYEDSPSPKRLVGIQNAAHLFPSSLCTINNDAGQDFIAIARDNGVCTFQLTFASFLFDCPMNRIDDDLAREITNYATSAAFEETLHCQDRADAWSQIQTLYPAVTDFREG